MIGRDGTAGEGGPAVVAADTPIVAENRAMAICWMDLRIAYGGRSGRSGRCRVQENLGRLVGLEMRLLKMEMLLLLEAIALSLYQVLEMKTDRNHTVRPVVDLGC